MTREPNVLVSIRSSGTSSVTGGRNGVPPPTTTGYRNMRSSSTRLSSTAAAAREATDQAVSIGGAGLAAQAFELGLVDELRMFRYPVVVGGGTPFLPPVREHVSLELIETRTFGSRVIYERYRRARDESD